MKKLAVGCLVIILAPVVLLVIVIVIGSGSSDRSNRSPSTSPPATQKAQETTGKTARLNRGDTGVLTDRAMLGVTEKNYDRITQLSTARDAMGLAEMEKNGQLFVADKGTSVLVIAPGLFTHEVRVLGGPHQGRSGIIAVEFVAKP